MDYSEGVSLSLVTLSITSLCGLFQRDNYSSFYARMTGVEGRPEVIIEGTNADPEGKGWKVCMNMCA